jgi:5-(carboxyamino)imidazole ribonucleotide synthase
MKIGIIGAGQLGRMLGFAGLPLNFEFVFLDPSENPPAAAAGRVIQAKFDDPRALRELAERVDVVTFEFENIPVRAVEPLLDIKPVYPPPEALHFAQDRLHEKTLFTKLGIPVADWRTVDSLEDLRAAAAGLGLPLVLKTRRLGYDGKGQFVIRTQNDIALAWETLGSVPLIAEQCINFDCEVSVVAARGISGETAVYPLTENRHEDGILKLSKAPHADETLQAAAEAAAEKLMTKLDYVGVLAIEFFVCGNRLMANEFAPRVHNSGHWTIEGARCSQFENHLRAICGLPLGSTDINGHSAMLNLIGDMPPRDAVLKAADCHIHDYGKAPRPGRKLGHVTLVRRERAELEAGIASLQQACQ